MGLVTTSVGERDHLAVLIIREADLLVNPPCPRCARNLKSQISRSRPRIIGAWMFSQPCQKVFHVRRQRRVELHSLARAGMSKSKLFSMERLARKIAHQRILGADRRGAARFGAINPVPHHRITFVRQMDPYLMRSPAQRLQTEQRDPREAVARNADREPLFHPPLGDRLPRACANAQALHRSEERRVGKECRL